jgi:hypothetical protein
MSIDLSTLLFDDLLYRHAVLTGLQTALDACHVTDDIESVTREEFIKLYGEGLYDRVKLNSLFDEYESRPKRRFQLTELSSRLTFEINKIRQIMTKIYPEEDFKILLNC